MIGSFVSSATSTRQVLTGLELALRGLKVLERPILVGICDGAHGLNVPAGVPESSLPVDDRVNVLRL